MSTKEHVHDCTGPNLTCPCGWKFVVPRFAFSVDVFDNQTKRNAIDHTFMTDSVEACASALERAARKMRALR